MRFKPRDYQEEAIEAIRKGLKEKDRATAVMACGTGKTLVALWAAERIAAQRIVVFMPSLLLIKQTIETWTQQTNWPWFNYMAICCDDKLLDDDVIEIDAKECCFDICINAEQVHTFMEGIDRGVRIVFCTYQSSNIIPKDIEFDLGIFDESHKTAHKDKGAFRHALYDHNIPIKKRLFLTATPRHYQLKGRVQHLEYSMSNEEVYGPVVYRLDFAEAIKRKIICDYKILITVLNDEIVMNGCANKLITAQGKSFHMVTMSHVIALKQAFDKYPIKRAVAFLRTIKDTKELTRTAFNLKDMDCNILDINSNMSSDERTGAMRVFEHSTKAIISNARCLSEGVDIPSIDLVAFLSPKKSKIDIIQAIGRVMRNAKSKKYGYILLPIFVKDIRKIETILESSEYRYILQIINSLREYDTDLQQQISDNFLSRKEYGQRDKNKIEFINSDTSASELIKAIDVNILEIFKDGWDERFEEIKQWYIQNGSWSVKGRNNEYNAIRGWINWNRTFFKNGTLSPERINKLRSINFIFDMQEARNEDKFEHFKEIVERHGLRKTLRQYDPSMDNWFQFMKVKIKNGVKIPIIDRLLDYVSKFPNYEECIQIEEPRLRIITNRNIRDLGDYYAKNGHINIRYNENEKLAKWIDALHNGRYNNLSDNTRQSLIDMGFIYKEKRKKFHVEEWNRNYQLLQDYKQISPKLIFSKKDKNHASLRRWVVRQRDRYRRNSKFLPEQKEKLIAIGLFKELRKTKR